MLYWIKTPTLLQRLFYNQHWRFPNKDNKIYLTFDDGPIPVVTSWVLDVLKEYDIKATFFCIGDNINKHPDIFQKVIQEGHAIGNHTFNHLNGWKASSNDYLKNVLLCNEQLQLAVGGLQLSDDGLNVTQTRNPKLATLNLFRPPYGKIKPSQSKKLRKLGYKIVMWDILSGDFDQNITPEKCLQNATKKVKSGSILVFHDSLRAYKNLGYALPITIKILKEKGFVFDVIK
jgi:peptidoglycan-N-acetylglucosamine deacetylase